MFLKEKAGLDEVGMVDDCADSSVS
jgi:hypothetical protein